MTETARGRDIIEQILVNMRSQTEELRYSRIVSSTYNVHLHPDDHARLEGLFPEIVSQARRALDEELERLNRALPLEEKVRKLVQKPRLPYRRAANEWAIRVLADPNDELMPGDILVDAVLIAPQSDRFAGERTQRIVTHRRGDRVEHRRFSDDTVPAADGAPPAADGDSAPASPALATLRWSDGKGEHAFRMITPTIKIGRGGSAYWVDLVLDTVPDVSREHLRIRYDEPSKRFFIQDLSTYGTTVDGVAIPTGEEAETPLPATATIGLAGALVLRFESEAPA
jgi:hypothetical protein